MRDRNPLITHALRALMLAGIAALGLASIVGSGGGGIAFLPSDCPPGFNCNAPTPPSAAVTPAYVTALVGSSVTFAADPADFVGTVRYQWSRSSDGGATFIDVAGANARTLSLVGVNLADDRTIVRVVAQASGSSVQALGRLAVSATPPVVFADGEFAPADWTVLADPNAPAGSHSEQHVDAGGNPGSFRKMTFTIGPQSGAARALYASLPSVYSPQVDGAVYVIDYAEDGIALQANVSTYTESAMVLEQGGRRYVANLRSTPIENFRPTYLTTQWSAVASQSSLQARDFNLVSGPGCGAGEACPDFSAAGLQMRFGYWRISFGIQGDSIAHGIDNWKVSVWRR